MIENGHLPKAFWLAKWDTLSVRHMTVLSWVLSLTAWGALAECAKLFGLSMRMSSLSPCKMALKNWLGECGPTMSQHEMCD